MSQTIIQSQQPIESVKKLHKTRYEIEKLKTEIETLLRTSIENQNVVQQSNLSTTVAVDTNLSKAPVKTNPIQTKSSPISDKVLKSPVSVRQTTRSQSHKSEPNLLLALEEECKSKARNYDQKTTRDFIKKQREKRKLKLEEELRIKKEFTELKQQRLANLRHKTQELLIDNVMMKSSRNSAKHSEDKKPKTVKTVDVSKFSAQVEIKPISRYELQSRRCRYRSFDHEPKVSAKKPTISSNVKRHFPQRSKSVNSELTFNKHIADKVSLLLYKINSYVFSL